MGIEALAEWLKTSIPGIILLGALGSILAVLLVKLIFPTARVLRELARLIDHISARIAHRQVFLTSRFLEQCSRTRNPVSVLLLVTFRFLRCFLCGFGVFYCTKVAVWAYAQSPHSGWLFPSVIGAQLLFLAAFLDLMTLIMAYVYFVVVPMSKLKEKHKDDLSFAIKEAKAPSKLEHAGAQPSAQADRPASDGPAA